MHYSPKFPALHMKGQLTHNTPSLCRLQGQIYSTDRLPRDFQGLRQLRQTGEAPYEGPKAVNMPPEESVDPWVGTFGPVSHVLRRKPPCCGWSIFAALRLFPYIDPQSCSFARQASAAMLQGFQKTFTQALNHMIHGPPESSYLLKKGTEQPVDMDDPRIRVYEKQGDEEAQHWMNATVMATLLARTVLVRLSGRSDFRFISFGSANGAVD